MKIFRLPLLTLLMLPLLAAAAEPYNGTATVNNCSGGLFKMDGMGDDQPGLVITNGHCVVLKGLRAGSANYPAAGERIYDQDNIFVRAATTIILYTGKSSAEVKATKLIFATMTGTDVAIYQLEKTYREIQAQYGAEPLRLDSRPFVAGDSALVHAAYFSRTQACAVEGFTDLREGPYETKQGLRLTKECDIYPGFSGSPVFREGGRTFAGLANTHFDDTAPGADCAFSKPCEVDPVSGAVTPAGAGRSFGVPADFLYRCFDPAKGALDFTLSSCPYPQAGARGPASFGGQTIPAGDPLDHTLVAIGNAKSQVCSGTFVAKDVVLTAAHCVIPDQDGDAIGRVGDFVYPLSLPEGYNPLLGEKIRIVKVSLHPRKEQLDVKVLGYPIDNPDMALLKLERPYAEAVPAALSPREAPAGATVETAGFGRGNQNWQRPSKLSYTVAGDAGKFVEDNYENLSTDEAFDFMRAFRAQIGEISPYFQFVSPAKPGLQTVCYGDSGSPLFISPGGRPEVIGVASMIIPHEYKGNVACNKAYVNLFSKVAPHIDWLREEITNLSEAR